MKKKKSKQTLTGWVPDIEEDWVGGFIYACAKMADRSDEIRLQLWLSFGKNKLSLSCSVFDASNIF